MLKAELGEDFLKVTPGIRMASDDQSDQTRVCTPREALAQGATHLVIGRSITAAVDPSAALAAILESIG
jgi:orotidine-5'-phosphate decarboxylase